MLDRAKPGHSSLVDDRELAPAFLEHQRESIAQRGRRGDGGIKRVVAVWNGKQLDVRESPDRKSTRLNSSHGYISYAVFCLKKKKTPQRPRDAAPRTAHAADAQETGPDPRPAA